MSTLLIKNIRCLVSCDRQDTVYENVNLLCEDGLIKSITPSDGRKDGSVGPGRDVTQGSLKTRALCASEGDDCCPCESVGNVLPQAADTVIDGRDMFVYPGLVNTHHHLYQVFSRNLRKVQSMELFDWLKTLYEIWKNLNEDTVYLSSLTGMAELMKNGCTTVTDHHYVFPMLYYQRRFHSSGAI